MAKDTELKEDESQRVPSTTEGGDDPDDGREENNDKDNIAKVRLPLSQLNKKLPPADESSG